VRKSGRIVQAMFALWIIVSVSPRSLAAPPVHVSVDVKLHLIGAKSPTTDGGMQTVWQIDLKQLVHDLNNARIETMPANPRIASAVLDQLLKQVSNRLQTGGMTLPPNVIWTTPDNVDSSQDITLQPDTSLGDGGTCDGSKSSLPDPTIGAKQCWQMTVDLDVSPTNTITINFTSEGVTTAQPVNKTFVAVASELHLKPHPEDENITVVLRINSYDIETEALHVAEEIREILSKNGVEIRGPSLDWLQIAGLDVSQLLNALAAPFNSDSSRVQSLQVSLKTLGNGDTLVVSLDNVKFVDDVAFMPAVGASSDAVAVVRSHYYDRLKSRFSGRVVYAQDLARTLYELRTDPYVKDAQASYSAKVLTFTIDTRTILKSVALSAGGGYTTQTSFYGMVSGTFENLFGKGDTLEGETSLGPNLAKFALSGSVPESSHPFPAGRFQFSGLTLSGSLLLNNKTHFQAAGTGENTNTENLLTGTTKFSLDSFSAHDLVVWPDTSVAGRKRARHLLTISPGYEIGQLKAVNNATNLALVDGQIATFSAQPTYLFDWDLRRTNCSCGLAELRGQIDASSAKGIRKVGGDFAYDSAYATGTAELSFGIREPYQFLLRSRAGAGNASRGTPLQRLFQVGGADYVRGLEKGEFTPNTLLWQQSEAGASLPTVWGWIRSALGRPNSSQACSSPGPSPLPFSLARSYLELFWDHARASEGTSLRNVPDRGSSLQGYGFAIELGQLQNSLNLSIGWGYSPQSYLHKHGVMFVGATFR
jgi:hypothetical protein